MLSDVRGTPAQFKSLGKKVSRLNSAVTCIILLNITLTLGIMS